MGASVSNFAANVAKTVAKSATTALGNMIPVVGPTLAGAINSAYKNGGQVTALEMGGVVPEGFKAKVIDTPKQLMTLVKQFPTEAKKAGLSLGIIKDAVANIPAEMMKRGGRKKKVVRQKQKQTQNVKVNVRVGDTVMLRPDSQKPKLQPRMSYTEPLRLAGPGFTFANAPAPSQASTYANAPAAVRPMMDRPLQSSADPSMDSNRNKGDDVLQTVNPSGIKPGVNEFRAVPSGKSASQGDAENALPAVSSSSLFEGRPVGPVQGGVPEVRAIPSNMIQSTLDFAPPGGEPSAPAEASSKSSVKRITKKDEVLEYLRQLNPNMSKTAIGNLRKSELEKMRKFSTDQLQENYGSGDAEESLVEELSRQVMGRRGQVMARGGRMSVF
jgi:hypothetical protein